MFCDALNDREVKILSLDGRKLEKLQANAQKVADEAFKNVV